MVKKMAKHQEVCEKQIITINDYCQFRIKPKLIREVKTEAVLVFARTALERFFAKLDQDDTQIQSQKDEKVEYLYQTLRALLKELQIYVVNVDYLMDLMRHAKQYPLSMELRRIAKYEEPLILYYDSMAKRVEHHFPTKQTAIPEFIVLCVLCNWFLEDEKSTTLYKFIERYNFLELIDIFEQYIQLHLPEHKKLLTRMHSVSIDVVEVLKKVKYKFNTQRVSKIRKKR